MFILLQCSTLNAVIKIVIWKQYRKRGEYREHDCFYVLKHIVINLPAE